MSTPEAAQAQLQEEARQRLAQSLWNNEPAPAPEPLRLIHELRVHQIELEMATDDVVKTITARLG